MGSTESRESYSVTTRSMARSGTRKQSNKYWTRTRTGGGDESGGNQTGGGDESGGTRTGGRYMLQVYSDWSDGGGYVVAYMDSDWW